MTTRHDIDRIGMTLSLANILLSKVGDLKRVFGTCTDISALIGLSDAEKSNLPIFSDSDIRWLEWAVHNNFFDTMFGLPAARDGRKILAFVRAVKDAQAVGFSREFLRVSEECEWQLVRYALTQIVTNGQAVAMQNVRDIAAECVEVGCSEHETVKDFARAFSLAKNHTEKQLERLWLELFEDHGVDGAVALFRQRWKPLDDATRDKVNAAFLEAKEKFKNERNERNAISLPRPSKRTAQRK